MPPRYRAILALLGAFLTGTGLLGLWSGLQLAGGARFRGIAGGMIAAAAGIYLVWHAGINRLPRWMANLFGDPTDSS